MTGTEQHFTPDKKREYRLYLIWKSLDKTFTPEQLETYGITDETLLELSNIKTQKELAEYLQVKPHTITDWNKQPVPEEYRELDWRYWAKQLTPKIVASFSKQAIKTGSPNHFTGWMKYVEQVEEKQAITVDASQELFDQIKAIAESVKDD